MRKHIHKAKLAIQTQTLRPLTTPELAGVQGAGPGGSTHSGCGNRPTLKDPN